MNRQVITVAMAFVGLVVGAGFASGKEILQYFVGFGVQGMWAVTLALIIFGIAGYAILQLGSFFLASDHKRVLTEVSPPITSRFFDILITLTLFSMGFVMIAGGGTSLNQQFGLPVWVGSVIITVLVILVGMLDVDRVTAIIGSITPFIIVLIVGAAIWSYTHIDYSFAQLNDMAIEVGSTLPNWWISATNYVALALAMAVSMSIVMGGQIRDPRVAGRGGMLGGIIYGLLILIASSALFTQIDKVGHSDMPTLMLLTSIHPAFGTVMAFVVFGMIFNTAIGMYYALASRFSKGDPKRFRIWLVSMALIGFVISFVGFETFVSYLYPVIGYAGMLLILLLVVHWVRSREDIREEVARRMAIRKLLRRLMRHDKHFHQGHADQLADAIEQSPVDNSDLQTSSVLEVVDELEDEGLAYNHPATIDFEEITNVELEEDALDDYEEPETDQATEGAARAEETDSASTSASTDDASASTQEANPEKPV
ncbi:YkvI family membrane protein [Actinomyces urinae]|uniref:YkvI family membrane protein n=1 Tax=Actinomyces urinae TaxID=1689268 RepID=UPI000930DED1|nr:hypothetical protein [Actinomyces urinae]